MPKLKLLILSFSPISDDARVLKQVNAFRDEYDVTTCGYGPAPSGVAEHIQIPESVLHNVHHDGRITRKAYKRAYWKLWSIAWAKRHLKRGAWDIVLADDVEAVPVALRLRPAKGVHADLHEYSPLQHEDRQGWREKITPYVEWVVHEYVTQASSWTTVGEGLAREYEKNFGFRPDIVTNATPFHDLEPSAVGDTVRLVHSGAAMGDRRLEDMIAAVAASPDTVTLDLFLTHNQPAYVDQLREQADATNGRVRVLDPVPYERLIPTLQQYDYGVAVLPPTNFNMANALPNKLFDYVQARLGVIVGPTPEMAKLVAERDLGFVTDDFSVEAMRDVFSRLTSESARVHKASSHANARELSAETQVEGWRTAISALATR